MDFAETQAVFDDGKAVLLVIGNDVCGIEQLSVPKSAHSAPCLVGEEDAATEFRLM